MTNLIEPLYFKLMLTIVHYNYPILNWYNFIPFYPYHSTQLIHLPYNFIIYPHEQARNNFCNAFKVQNPTVNSQFQWQFANYIKIKFKIRSYS
jgi:hypothetical protein